MIKAQTVSKLSSVSIFGHCLIFLIEYTLPMVILSTYQVIQNHSRDEDLLKDYCKLRYSAALLISYSKPHNYSLTPYHTVFKWSTPIFIPRNCTVSFSNRCSLRRPKIPYIKISIDHDIEHPRFVSVITNVSSERTLHLGYLEVIPFNSAESLDLQKMTRPRVLNNGV